MTPFRRRTFHILQVVHSLVIGGTERVVCDLTRHFNDGRYRTSVCCLDELGEFGKDLLDEGVNVHVYNRRPGIDVSLLRKVRRLYSEQDIDLVHAHQYTPYFYGAAACIGPASPKVIFTEHGRHQPDHVRPKRVLFNQVLRRVTAGYTAVSDFTRRSLVDFERMPASRIRVIFNGVRAPGRLALPDKRFSREKLGIGLDRKVILSIGRIDPIKDFETLIHGFSRVAGNIPEALLLIAGGGDGNYLKSLQDIVTQRGIGDRVKFLGTRRDIPELLAACDVFALTSITEAASMTILEAMAAGRAVVTTQTGGNAELVVEGHTGLLVPVGAHEAVAEALTHAVTRLELAGRMGEAGRERYESLFTLDATLGSYERLYEEILNP